MSALPKWGWARAHPPAATELLAPSNRGPMHILVRGWELLQAAQFLSAVVLSVGAGMLSPGSGVAANVSPFITPVALEGATSEVTRAATPSTLGPELSPTSALVQLPLRGACASER